MGLNTYILRQQMKWLRRRISKDVQHNEEKARKKLLRAFPPLLEIFDIDDEFQDINGRTEKRLVTTNDLATYETERLVTLFDTLIKELETKV